MSLTNKNFLEEDYKEYYEDENYSGMPIDMQNAIVKLELKILLQSIPQNEIDLAVENGNYRHINIEKSINKMVVARKNKRPDISASIFHTLSASVDDPFKFADKINQKYGADYVSDMLLEANDFNSQKYNNNDPLEDLEVIFDEKAKTSSQNNIDNSFIKNDNLQKFINLNKKNGGDDYHDGKNIININTFKNKNL